MSIPPHGGRFPNRIVSFREQQFPRPLLQRELAFLAGCHPKQMARYERGDAIPGGLVLVRIAAALKVPNPELLLGDDVRESVSMEVEARRNSLGTSPTRSVAPAKRKPQIDDERPVLAVVMHGRSAGLAIASRYARPHVRAVRLRGLPDVQARLAKLRVAVQIAVAEQSPRVIVLPMGSDHDLVAESLSALGAPIRRCDLRRARQAVAGGAQGNLVVRSETALANRFAWLWLRLRDGARPEIRVRDDRIRYWRPAFAALALAIHLADPSSLTSHDLPFIHADASP